MHIQERSKTILTTCSKMTEEVDRRHGVNGNSSGKGVPDDVGLHGTANASAGGRLKFFKDGKFILELVRGGGRDGERSGWVSVPRKTFWPPAAPAAPPTHPQRNDRATSLSVSDDNSSIQSSPWQRDHCWKQNNPRKNISKELTFYYCRPNSLPNNIINIGTKLKRRRPMDGSHLEISLNGNKKSLSNGLCHDKNRNGLDIPDGRSIKNEDAVDGPSSLQNKPEAERWADCDRERYYHMKLKKPYQYHKLRVYKKTKPSTKRKELNKTIEKLREKIASLPVPVNAKLVNCKQEHMMVSPRKRILREMERFSLEDQGTKRRAKTVPALSTAAYPASPGPSHAPPRAPVETSPWPAEPAASRPHNGTTSSQKPPVTKNVSSYSIHSLLSMPDETPAADAKRSPHSYTPSNKTESPSSINSPDLSPSPDNFRYRYSLALGSPGQTAPRDTPTPPSYRATYVPQSTPPYQARRTSPQWGQPLAAYRGSPARDTPSDWPYMYPAGYAPYYPPQLYRPPPSQLWMHYAGIPPGPWAPLPHPLLSDHIVKEEPTSDLPLNLSKH